MDLNKNINHNKKVRTYFDKASSVFDTFYDHQRSLFMQWVDKNFRSDMFIRYRLTFESITPLDGNTVLDVGCGSGSYAVEAVRLGSRRVVGLDIAHGMIDLARQRALARGVDDKCEFVLGTFPENSPCEVFDYAIVMGVMDYIADPLAFLSVLAKHVQKRAVLSFPSKHWFRTPLRKIRYRLKKCPLYFYNPQQIKELMEKTDFSGIKIEKIPGTGMDFFVTADRTKTP